MTADDGSLSDSKDFTLTVHPAPPQEETVDFAASQTEIAPGEAVGFTDLSTGSPVSWQWDFDANGIIGWWQQIHPIHTSSRASTR